MTTIQQAEARESDMERRGKTMSKYSDLIASNTDEGTRQTLMDAFSLCLTLHGDRLAAERAIDGVESELVRERGRSVDLRERMDASNVERAEQANELQRLRRDLAALVVVKADRDTFMRQASEWQNRAGVMQEHLINVERRFVPENFWTDPHPDREHPNFMPTDERVAASMQRIFRVLDAR